MINIYASSEKNLITHELTLCKIQLQKFNLLLGSCCLLLDYWKSVSLLIAVFYANAKDTFVGCVSF